MSEGNNRYLEYAVRDALVSCAAMGSYGNGLHDNVFGISVLLDPAYDWDRFTLVAQREWLQLTFLKEILVNRIDIRFLDVDSRVFVYSLQVYTQELQAWSSLAEEKEAQSVETISFESMVVAAVRISGYSDLDDNMYLMSFSLDYV